MQIKISVPGGTFGAHDMRCYFHCRRRRKTKIEAFVLNLPASIHNAPLCCHLDGVCRPHPSLFILLPPYTFLRTDLYADVNPYDASENLAARTYLFVENSTLVRNCAKIFLFVRNIRNFLRRLLFSLQFYRGYKYPPT